MQNNSFLTDLLNKKSHIVPTDQVTPPLSPFSIGSIGPDVILNLRQLMPLLKRCLLLVREVFSNKGQVVLIVNHRIPSNLERAASHFFIIMKGGWSEGTLSNLSVVKKTCYDLEEKVKHETRVSKKLSKKTKSRLVRFFKKYKTLGYLSGNPRLIISLFPIKNPLFFKEVRLQNIPVISLGPQSVNKSTTQTVDYPVPLINNSDFLGNFLIRLLLLEAKKGHRSYILKFRVRKLSNFERFTFLQKVKSLPKF